MLVYRRQSTRRSVDEPNTVTSMSFGLVLSCAINHGKRLGRVL